MTVLHTTRLLSEVELFRGLPDEHLAELDRQLNRKDLPAGTLLMSPEQLGDSLFVIAEGSVKIFLNRDDGSEVIFAILGIGQTVGEMSLFARSLRSANVLTMERSVFLCMSGSVFRSCLQSMPVLSYNLNRLLSVRLRLANQQIVALSSLDVAGRVAREILAFAEQYGKSEGGRIRIPLRLTQSDIASIVGTSRERVNQIMVRWKQRGYLSVDRSFQIIVHDHAALCRCCGWAGAA